jgi:excinuclease ABC subunit A
VVIEHNLDVIKTADWILDLGPEGGVRGGEIVAEGTPEQVAANPRSFTGAYLKPMLAKASVQAPPKAKRARAREAAE